MKILATSGAGVFVQLETLQILYKIDFMSSSHDTPAI